ncbi:acyltransferase [soil metagenome]
MQKLGYVNALRGLAILGVIMVHANLYGHSSLPHVMQLIIEKGQSGVQLFFLASAFTLFRSFKLRSITEASPTRNFFFRRFFRIAPMYYAGILFYVIQNRIGFIASPETTEHFTAANIISNFTFLHGFNPYWMSSIVPGGWSIAIEMTFYALLPFLFSRIKTINHAFYFFIISVFLRIFFHLILLKFPLISFESLWTEYLFLYFPSQLPLFALGIIMYFLIFENKAANVFSGKALLISSGLLLAILSIDFIPTQIVFGVAFLILGVALSKYNFRGIVNPLIEFIGKISFSMYLVHFAVFQWLTNLNFIDYSSNGIVDYAARFIIGLALTVIISSVTYYLIEIPFQNLGKKLIDKMEKRQLLKVAVLILPVNEAVL